MHARAGHSLTQVVASSQNDKLKSPLMELRAVRSLPSRALSRALSSSPPRLRVCSCLSVLFMRVMCSAAQYLPSAFAHRIYVSFSHVYVCGLGEFLAPPAPTPPPVSKRDTSITVYLSHVYVCDLGECLVPRPHIAIIIHRSVHMHPFHVFVCGFMFVLFQFFLLLTFMCAV